jgi:hypothetical protein
MKGGQYGVMTNCKSILFGFAFAGAAFSMEAQGTFQNLDFESATIPASTAVDSPVSISEAIPDWNGYFTSGTTTLPATQAIYDGISTGGGEISIVDSMVYSSFAPVQGNYAVILFGGPLVGPVLYSASISQTGTIPPGTESLLMDARSFGGTPIVAINGQPISMAPVQRFPNYTVYGGNISSFAGSIDTLSFTAPAPTISSPTEFFLDDISFSPTAVAPEPDPLILTGIGGVLFALYRRFAVKRQ